MKWRAIHLAHWARYLLKRQGLTRKEFAWWMNFTRLMDTSTWKMKTSIRSPSFSIPLMRMGVTKDFERVAGTVFCLMIRSTCISGFSHSWTAALYCIYYRRKRECSICLSIDVQIQNSLDIASVISLELSLNPVSPHSKWNKNIFFCLLLWTQ